jgi:hypothetical protein
MKRNSRQFKIFAAFVSIPLFAIFLFGYSYVIFENSMGLSNIKYYSLLGLGFIGILIWIRISLSMIKEIKNNTV